MGKKDDDLERYYRQERERKDKMRQASLDAAAAEEAALEKYNLQQDREFISALKDLFDVVPEMTNEEADRLMARLQREAGKKGIIFNSPKKLTGKQKREFNKAKKKPKKKRGWFW